MPNNKVLAAFILAVAVIIYCAFASMVRVPSAQRIEREFGVSVVKFR